MNKQCMLHILAGTSLLCLAAAASAQGGEPIPPAPSGQAGRAGGETANNEEGTDPGDTIVVTARRRDEALQDVPLVVNAVTQEQIEKLNFRTFQDVQQTVPGLTLSSQANGTGGTATLRGVNFDVNASGFNPTVEFYYNDAPITSGVLLQSLFDIGQIEVLRGPQGTLRGRASPSGSIIVTTRRPDLNEFGGTINATGNDIGTINVNGGLGIPIIPGVAAIRIAGLVDQNDFDRVKTINTSTNRRNPYSQTKAGRITGRVEPADWLSVEGGYQRLDRTIRAYDQVASFSEVNPAAAASPVLIRAKDRRSIYSAPRTTSQTYDIYNGQAQLSGAGQRLVYVFQHYTLRNRAFSPQDEANVFPTRAIGQTLRNSAKSTSHEVRLQNDTPVFGMFDYVLGGLDIKTNSPTNLIQQTAVALPPQLGGSIATIANTPIRRGGSTHEQSVFGNVTAHVGEKLELSGGLRYIDYHSEGVLVINNATTIPDPTVNDDHVIYTASAKYAFSPDFMVYANTGSSYRPAIFAVGDFSVQQSALERSFLALPPETSKSYEIGFKSTLFDRRLRLNATVFHQDFKNYPYRAQSGVFYVNYAATVLNGVPQVTPGVGQFNFVAATPVDVNGVEGEIAFSASERLDVSLIGSYSLGKIKKGTVACLDLNRDGVPDSVTTAPTLAQLQAVVGANNLSACQVSQRSSFSPPFSATLQSEYRMPLSDKVESYLRGLATYYGKSQADPTNLFDDVDSYTLVNLYAGIRDPRGRWELALFAKNLLDTDKALARTTPTTTTYQVLQPPTFRTTAAVTTTSTYNRITSITPPREFGVNFRFNFGSR